MTTEVSPEVSVNIENGQLTGVTETHDIFKTADRCRVKMQEEVPMELNVKDLVSMNMWGLTPALYGYS